MHWLQLFGAIVFEVAGTTSMKLSNGFTRLWPSVALFVCYAISFTLMTFALKRIGVTVVYPVWSGLGTVAIAIIGVYWFGEEMTWLKVISIAFVIIGVVGLSVGKSTG